MAAKIDVGLLAGQDQEIAVRMPAAGFEIIAQILEPEASGVVRVAVAVEIVKHDDVDSQMRGWRRSRAASLSRLPPVISSLVNAVWKCVTIIL